MSLYSFLKEMLPHLDKDNVQEDIRITIDELTNIVMPSYSAASANFKSNKLKSPANAELSKIFYKNADLQGMSKQASFIGDIDVRLKFLRENAIYIQGLVEDLMERDIIKDGLTAKKAVILKAASNISFLSRYSIDLLNIVAINESKDTGSEFNKDLDIPPIKRSKTEAAFPHFSRVFADYAIPPTEFEKIIGKIPEVNVSEKSQNVIKGVYKDNEIDPLASGYISGFDHSPIYTIRLLFAEWQAKRYDANKNKKKMLEMRLMYLKMQKENKQEPKIEQEIEYLQNRINRIDQYLRDVEESL